MDQSFCAAPWNTIYITPSGDIENCCVSNNQLGQFPAKDLINVLTSKEYIEIKSQMLNGTLPAGCKMCDHTDSTLKKSLNSWLKVLPTDTFYQDVNNFKLEYLDVRWNNTCNSACVYCGPTWSSKWAEELEIAQPINTVKTLKLKEFFYTKLKDIKIAYLAGGEPLLSKDNEWLLEALFDQNPNCKIRINTNLTNLNTRVYQLLQKFKNKTWIISGESTGERYEYVRYGSKWSEFEQNVKKLLSHQDKEVVFHTVYSALTASDLPDYINWVISLGVSPGAVSCYFYNGGTGGPYDPRLLPSSVINKCQSSLTELSNQYRYIPSLKKQFDSLIMHMDIPLAKEWTYDNMIKTLNDLDTRRGTDNNKIFPELAE